MENPTIAVTYTTVTRESAENGEPSDTGFMMDPEQITPDAVAAYLEEGISGFMAELLTSELYDTLEHGCHSSNGVDFYTVDAYTDYTSGEATTYAAHLGGEWPESLRENAELWLTPNK